MLKRFSLGSGLGIIFSCILLGILTSFPNLYVLLTQENQNFELLTAVFYAISGLVLFYVIIKQYRSIHPIGIVWTILLATFFIFIAGEEESWGQWFFHYNVSENIKELNTQNEINIHNLNIFSGMLNPHFILNLFILGYGVILPLANMSYTSFRNLSNKLNLLVPSVAISGWFITALVYEKVAWTISNPTFENWRHAEVVEFMFSIGILALSTSAIKQYVAKSKSLFATVTQTIKNITLASIILIPFIVSIWIVFAVIIKFCE